MTYFYQTRKNEEPTIYDYWRSFKPATHIHTINTVGSSDTPTLFYFDLIGCPKDAIKISIEDGAIKVDAEFTIFGNKKSYHKTGVLQFEPDYDNIKCDYQEGVLRVEVPRKVTKKEITIK